MCFVLLSPFSHTQLIPTFLVNMSLLIFKTIELLKIQFTDFFCNIYFGEDILLFLEVS